MNYTKIKITSTSDKEDRIIGILYELDMNNFVCDNHAEEFEKKIWTDDSDIARTKDDKLEIEIYFNEEESNKIMLLRESLKELKDIQLEQEIMEDVDWENDWKKFYRVLRYDDDIVVYPSWENYEAKQNEIAIRLNAGMAFGNGDHETTTMCIGLLKKYMKNGDKVIDVGTGTGILSILASKLGASEVLATEVDENLIEPLIENLRINNVENVKVECADLLYKYAGLNADLMVANIITEVAKELIKDIRDNLKPDGILIISAISNEKLDSMIEALVKFKIVEIKKLGDWNTIVIKL